MALFEGLSVPLKTERGRRVFPVSDKASDIVRALRRYAESATLRFEHVRGLGVENGRITGVFGKDFFPADAFTLRLRSLRELYAPDVILPQLAGVRREYPVLTPEEENCLLTDLINSISSF